MMEKYSWTVISSYPSSSGSPSPQSYRTQTRPCPAKITFWPCPVRPSKRSLNVQLVRASTGLRPLQLYYLWFFVILNKFSSRLKPACKRFFGQYSSHNYLERPLNYIYFCHFCRISLIIRDLVNQLCMIQSSLARVLSYPFRYWVPFPFIVSNNGTFKAFLINYG